MSLTTSQFEILVGELQGFRLEQADMRAKILGLSTSLATCQGASGARLALKSQRWSSISAYCALVSTAMALGMFLSKFVPRFHL